MNLFRQVDLDNRCRLTPPKVKLGAVNILEGLQTHSAPNALDVSTPCLIVLNYYHITLAAFRRIHSLIVYIR